MAATKNTEKRRRKGSGSIYKNASGSFVGRISISGYEPFSCTGKTQKEVEKKLEEYRTKTIRKPANKKSSVFLKKISKIRFDILCITFKPPEMPALKVVI